MNNLKTWLRFPCLGLNTIIDYISHPSIPANSFQCKSNQTKCGSHFFYCVPKNTRKNTTCCFAYLAMKVVKHYLFLMFKSMKTQIFHDKDNFLFLSAAT